MPLPNGLLEKLDRTGMKNPGEEYKYLSCLYWNSGWEMGFSGGSVVRNLPANAVDTSLIPGLGRSSAERNENPP